MEPVDLDRLDAMHSEFDRYDTHGDHGTLWGIYNAYPAMAAELRALRAEVERIEKRPWDVLMEILDRVYPAAIFPTTHKADEPDRDPGPRIVAMTRWVDELRAENERLRAVRDAAAIVEQCRGGDLPGENIVPNNLLDDLRTALDAAAGGA